MKNIFKINNLKNSKYNENLTMQRQNKSSPDHKDNNRKKKDDSFQWQKATRTFLFWLIFIIIAIWMASWFTNSGKHEAKINITSFREFLKNELIAEVVIEGEEFHGVLKQAQPHPEKPGNQIQNFVVVLPQELDINTVFKWMDEYGFKAEAKPKSIKWWGYMIQALPLGILIVFWFVMLRRMQGGGAKGIFSFGKSRAKLLTENKMKVTFEDVAGADEAKQELKEIIEFKRNRLCYFRYGRS